MKRWVRSGLRRLGWGAPHAEVAAEVVQQRQIRLRDRYGHEIESNPTLEHFAELYDSIAGVPSDEDWRDVSISDSENWCVTVTPDVIAFENVEADEEEGEIRPVTRQLALSVADDFIRGDFAAIRARLS